MSTASKTLALTLILLMTLTSLMLLTAEPVTSQSIPKPSVPEFNAKLISPPEESQSVNRTIQLSIKNQPSFSDYGFFYIVRARINDGNWSLLYTIDNVPAKSSGEYTVFSYPSDGPVVEYQYYLGDRIENLFAGDKVDFQVQAMIGSIHRVYNPNHTSQLDMYPYVFTGEVSDWSNTQTITMPDGSISSPAPDPTTAKTTSTTPTSPDAESPSNILFVGITIVAVILALSVLFIIRRKKPSG
jgi:hypothetical protein